MLVFISTSIALLLLIYSSSPARLLVPSLFFAHWLLKSLILFKYMMLGGMEEKTTLHAPPKDMLEGELEDSSSTSIPRSPINQSSRPSSMIIKKAHTVIPAHIVAEAISTIRGLDLRWSGPITPSEMQFVEQYVFAKYPQYYNGVFEQGDNSEESSSEIVLDEKRKSPKSSSPSLFSFNDLDKSQLEPSRLLDILSKKSSFRGNFISIPEIQARNRALKHCGLSEDEYLVLFMPNCKDAMLMIVESYPFFKGNYYLTIIPEDSDFIKGFATQKESKVIAVPETWLDLRIKGSQLSQNFRRKCKYTPKGLFSYPVIVNGTRYSMHWISEAHRNSWHVLLDATDLDFGDHRLALALHRPDFVLCTLDNNTHAQQPLKISCLLVRRKSFDSATSTSA